MLKFCHEQVCRAPSIRNPAINRLYASFLLLLYTVIKSPAYKGTSGYLGEIAVDNGKVRFAYLHHSLRAFWLTIWNLGFGTLTSWPHGKHTGSIHSDWESLLPALLIICLLTKYPCEWTFQTA